MKFPLTEDLPLSIPDCHIIKCLDDLNNFTKSQCKFKVNILHINIRSLRANFDNFISHFSNVFENIDIIVLSETWIYDYETNFYLIDGYNSFFCCRNNNRSGGIAVYIKKYLDISELNIHFVSAESILVYNKQLHLILLTIYRSHEFAIDFFIAELKSILSELKYPNIVLIGDLNIDVFNENRNVHEYINLLCQFGFQSYIDKPTRINSSSTCIDHAFVKTNKFSVKSGVFLNDISDHYPIICSLCTKDMIVTNEIKSKTFINYDRLFEYLTEYKFNWSFRNSLDEQYQNFAFKLNNIKNSFKYSIKLNKRFKNNWMTNTILILIRRKEKLFKKTRKYPWDIIYKTAYKTTICELKNTIKSAKSEYFQNKFLNCNTNKQKYDIVNDIIGYKNKPSVLPENYSDYDSSCQFNQTFSNSNQVLNPSSNGFQTYISPSLSSFVLIELNDSDVLYLINTLSNKTSSDYDGISIKLIRQFALNNVNFITNFINTSFDSSYFPTSLKKATITPIFKSGDKNCFSNYRPISILPVFSKIIEKAIADKMYNFLNYTKFFSENQYGFIKGKSTEKALLEFSKFVHNSIEKSKKTVAIFLDISKAFDHVNHNILVKKLEYAGFRGNILKWFISYLSNREQRVKIRNKFSNYIFSTRGVPQGSILGPLLFIIFINDFCKLKLFGKIITYADDSVILYSCLNINELTLQIESDLLEISKWFAANDLKLNLNKTKCIYFNLKQSESNLNLKFHSFSCSDQNCQCYTIETVNSVKYLGLYIDSNMKWKSHINYLVKKLRYTLVKFYHLKYKIHFNFMKTLYYSWFYSLINYGIIIYGGEYKTNLFPLISIQNKCFKILNSNRNSNNTTNIYTEINLLPFRHNAFFRILLYLHRNKSICKLKTNVSERRRTEIFEIPHYIKEISRKQFYYLAPKLYNKLPFQLQSNQIYTSFKHALFELLINIDDLDQYFLL